MLQPLAGPTTTTDVGRGGLVRFESSRHWQAGLPVLRGTTATLRELRTSDAASLLSMMTPDDTARFISPPPPTLDGFRRFIAWTYAQRLAGQSICFGVVPAGGDGAVGIFQVRELEPGFSTGEWGFVLGSAYWGTGIFLEGARHVLNFSFEDIGVHRLEARSHVGNGRGNGALRKLGATQEGVLRRSFLRNGTYHDQLLWSILREDWFQAKAVWGPKFH